MDFYSEKFDILKMRAIFKPVWVRKLIGKLGVPYNRRLGVRGSSHPLNYDADLSLPAAESNAFRIQSRIRVHRCPSVVENSNADYPSLLASISAQLDWQNWSFAGHLTVLPRRDSILGRQLCHNFDRLTLIRGSKLLPKELFYG